MILHKLQQLLQHSNLQWNKSILRRIILPIRKWLPRELGNAWNSLLDEAYSNQLRTITICHKVYSKDYTVLGLAEGYTRLLEHTGSAVAGRDYLKVLQMDLA